MHHAFALFRWHASLNLSGRGTLTFAAAGLALLLANLGVTPVRAHDPLDITAKIQVQKERIVVQLTLAWSTTRLLLAEGKPGAAPLPPDRFGEIKSALEQRAGSFLVFTTKAGPVAAPRAKAELTDDGDVKIDLEFSRPDAPQLRVDAALLKTLPDYGYHVITTIYGPAEGHISHEVLSPEKATCELAGSAP